MIDEAKFNPSYIGLRPDVLALLPAGTESVLDIGCSTGAFGESIKNAGKAKVVMGIELSPEMARDAIGKLDKVIVGDVEAPETYARLGDVSFDVIVLADVLEHLRDPWGLVARIRGFLKPKGMIIASIPNVRHIDTIFNLLVKGVWPYRDRGIHDRTHLRFFTRRNIEEMFDASGFAIERLQANYRIFERPHRINRYARYFAVPGVAPFLVFQYLVVATQQSPPSRAAGGQR